MKRITAALALGVLVALLVGTGVASASHGTDSARGHVYDAAGLTEFVGFFGTSTDPTTADVDFSAKANFNGTNPSGSARFTFANQDPNMVLTGEVTCLEVLDGTARISGPITDMRGGSTLTADTFVFEPQSFRIFARDSGKFSTQADFLGFVLSSEPATSATCTTSFTPASTVRDGEVVVHDG